MSKILIFGQDISPEDISISDEHLFHEVRRISLQISELSINLEDADKKLNKIHSLSKVQTYLLENFNLLNEFKLGKSSKNTISFSLRLLIQEILEELDLLSPNSSTRVDSTLTDITLNKDPIIIKSLIFNLLENAISHSSGKIELNLTNISNRTILKIENQNDSQTKSTLKHFGFGLALSSFISKELNADLEISKVEDKVVTLLSLPDS